MHIDPFGVEIWMNEWETNCTHNLAETCVESLTVAQLLELSGKNSDDLSALLSMKMTYGDIPGSEALRCAIAARFEKQTPQNIIATHGTIGANQLVHRALVSAGDRVVAVQPSYQQHYSIPASIGAEVVPVWLKFEDGYALDMDALRTAVGEGCKLIALTNPNNPTGALLDRAALEEVAEIARNVGAWVLCDEVYRGTDQAGCGVTAAMADVYEKGISTGGMSKAFSLAGLRMGWVVGPEEVIEAVAIQRDYDTISVGRIDDHFATMALQNADRVLARAQEITRGNLAIVEAWMASQPRLSWVKPASSTVTLLHYDLDVPSHDLCVRLVRDCGVLFTPGSAFGMERCVRIGFGNPRADLEAGLPVVSEFLASFD